MSKSEIVALEARAAVHEMLILHLITEMARQPEDGLEQVKRLFETTGRSLLNATGTVPESERQQLASARYYLAAMAEKFWNGISHLSSP